MKLALVTALLTAVIISAQQIDWGSGNPTVAYVSPGKCIDNSGKYFGHFAPFPGQGRPWGAASDCLGYCMTSKDSNQNSEWAWQLNGVELVNVTHNNGKFTRNISQYLHWINLFKYSSRLYSNIHFTGRVDGYWCVGFIAYKMENSVIFPLSNKNNYCALNTASVTGL